MRPPKPRPSPQRRHALALALLSGALLSSSCSPAQGPSDGGPGEAEDAGASDAGEDDAGSATPDIDPTCTANGCVRSIIDYGPYSAGQLATFVEAGVRIDNGYRVITATYVTDGRVTNAVVTLPDAEPPPGGFAVAVNHHGTAGLDDPCALSSGLGGGGLSGYFGARGFIGVAPDGVGLAGPGLHPYLVSASEGRTMLDAARAALDVALLYGVPTSGEAVFAGLSQGGHAALSAAAEHASYAPDIDARAFAAAAPASGFLEHWAAGLAFEGPHLAFHAMLVYAWADHYEHQGPPLFTTEYGAVVDDIMTELCLIDTAGGATIISETPDVAADVFAPSFLADFAAMDLSAWPAIAAGFAENRLGPYEQTAPVRVWQGDADYTVLKDDTDDVIAAFTAGGVDVTYTVVPGGGHVDVAFSFLGYEQLRTEEALAWLKAQLRGAP